MHTSHTEFLTIKHLVDKVPCSPSEAPQGRTTKLAHVTRFCPVGVATLRFDQRKILAIDICKGGIETMYYGCDT